VTITAYLVRHATHELVDRILVGRDAAVTLGVPGLGQAAALGRRFANEKLVSVQSSPQPRAQQTAEPIAASAGLPLEVAPQLDELDMGAWTGRSFMELDGDLAWQCWNSHRGSARPPGGESMLEVRDRIIEYVERACERIGDGGIVFVSHAEPIRAAILHYLGLLPEDFMRLPIDPGSVTAIVLDPRGGRIVGETESFEDFVSA
jgi:probable phosphoglycerate mutase